jgi:SEC-C motif-containing protein
MSTLVATGEAKSTVSALPDVSSACLCGSGLHYGNCCHPYHAGQLPPTPEATMRSRYVAYALGLADYLMATTHRDNSGFSKQTNQWRAELIKYCKSLTCHGLHIAQCTPASGEITPDTPASGGKGVVVFMAKLQQGDDAPPYVMHETSTFKRANKRWLYYSGINRLSPVTVELDALFAPPPALPQVIEAQPKATMPRKPKSTTVKATELPTQQTTLPEAAEAVKPKRTTKPKVAKAVKQ